MLRTDLIVKEATLEDMAFIISQAKEEGWNPGFYDALSFYDTDPHGFFVGLLGNEKIGCISAVAYDNTYGFIGLYIVLSNHRHKGFGRQLWAHGMNYLGTRAIGLDGVLKEQKNYEKSHFKFYYNNQRFERNDGGGHFSNNLIDLKKIPLDTLLLYDTSIFGLERARFLKSWIEMPNSCSLGKVENGTLTGYGVLRSCHNGFKIGPLFADDENIAFEIYDSLCAKAGNASIFLDIPKINPNAMKIIKKFNLKPGFETARMYKKTPPLQKLDKVFGVTSLELG